MKQYYTLFIAVLTFSTFFTSCTSVKTLVIDVDKPAPISLPPTFQNITIVNNAVIQPYNVGHSELVMGRPQNTQISVNNDSIDYILMQSIGEYLSHKNYFENIDLYEYPTRTDDRYTEIIPLEKEDIADIAKETNADVVLTINKVFISTQSNTVPANDYVADIYNILDLEANISYNLYSKEGNALMPTVVDRDSIFWSEARANHFLLSEPIPSRKDAMKAGAAILADRIASALVPYKDSQTRIFYSDVKDAEKFADQNEWDKARSLWIEGFNKTKKSKAKARIANNIALSYELSDNLKEALRWNQTSIDLFKEIQETSIDRDFLTSSELYKQVLLERVQDFRILDLNEKR